jgi:hypothetical protein
MAEPQPNGARRGRPRKAISAGSAVSAPIPAAVAEATTALAQVTAGRSLREIWDALPEREWARVFDMQPADSPGGKLAAVRTDPAMRTWTLERQCAEAGVSAVELQRMVSSVALGHAIIASSVHLGEVVEGVAHSAKAQLLTCELCLGLRDAGDELTTIEVAHPRIEGAKLKLECPKCGGMGKVRRDASPRAVETFLKLHGGLLEEGGPVVQLNQQFNFGSTHAAGVHRGQQLLEAGRKRGSSAAAHQAPITVTATPIPEPERA